ncbi:Transcriptional regulator PadR-like family protein [Clostridium amylolyticum]|uniref:Transcriptional regulator PadR-like family protein n=1 Tax=Clostridium amylolyticum TaxID=1121298 RepID=A0A1M6J7Q4_9CLOT|nr:PadR family transcriptional regulator [Clostridium amylolyticum]SHJ42706.1 Transcriptional regulator PadR-like family protein [Clostridium amylolyticum]
MNMDDILKAFMPMSETAFYILLSLTEPRHGYGIIQHTYDITNGRIKLGSGTVYGTLTKMEKRGVISVYSDGDRKTVYEITEVGKGLLKEEINRIKELYHNAVKYEGDL